MYGIRNLLQNIFFCVTTPFPVMAYGVRIRLTFNKIHKMDITTLLIGVAIVALCVLPFWLSGNARKRREKKLTDAINEMAKSRSTTICNLEICGNNAIGIDGSGRWLFYARCKGGLRECVDLENVRTCSIVDKPDTIGLSFVTDYATDIYFELFNSNVEATSDDESRLAERWRKIVVERLAAMKS